MQGDTTWATKRRWLVIGTLGAVIVAFAAIVAIATFYKTPTCTDGTQNQGETGPDCGGPCARACVSDVRPAQVRFARAVQSTPTRTDVIAYVDNPNQNAAAHGVHATVESYDANHTLVGHKEVTFDIAAGSTVPVFVEGIVQGSGAVITQTFFTVDPTSVDWIRTTGGQITFPIQNITWQATAQPSVTAVIVNPYAQVLANIPLVAVVFDASGQAIAASRTLVASLPSQGTASMIFTWSVPFSSPPARVEITPLIPVRVP